MTEETKPKRGAPRGNRNAYKHGFYSHAYTAPEKKDLSQTVIDHRQNNIKFFKVIISRTAQKIKPSASNPISFQENLIALQTIVFSISRLFSGINLERKLEKSGFLDEERDMIKFLERIGMTSSDIDFDMFGIMSITGKPGGQPGNHNAFKHGFYATHYAPEELSQLEDLNEDDFKDEIALVQVLSKRVFIGMMDEIPLADYLKAVRVLSNADACLERLNRERTFIFGRKYWFGRLNESLLEILSKKAETPD